MRKCESCKANRVCNHDKFNSETCGNYIPRLKVPCSECKHLCKEVNEYGEYASCSKTGIRFGYHFGTVREHYCEHGINLQKSLERWRKNK